MENRILLHIKKDGFMKKQILYSVIAVLTVLSGCANYSAPPLNDFSSEVIYSRPVVENEEENGVLVIAKEFSRVDCKKFLDRDVLSKGYQPVQLSIQNNSDDSYSFSLSRVGLSCTSPEEVANTVHTSTVGRATGYGVGALFIWPLAIPAIVDGIKSSEANEALDHDFASKTARDQTILPHSHFNKLIFVPVHVYQAAFELTLLNLETGKAETFNIVSG